MIQLCVLCCWGLHHPQLKQAVGMEHNKAAHKFPLVLTARKYSLGVLSGGNIARLPHGKRLFRLIRTHINSFVELDYFYCAQYCVSHFLEMCVRVLFLPHINLYKYSIFFYIYILITKITSINIFLKKYDILFF